jgi:hypothetical protein
MTRRTLSAATLGLFASLTLIGCASDARRYADAAATKAVAERPVALPGLPADCRLRERPVAHAPLVVGQDAHEAFRAERLALDRANGALGREHRREDRCDGWYDDLRTGMAKGAATQ